MTTYFGFGLADSMFPPACTLSRVQITIERAIALVEGGVVSCLNPSHAATVAAMSARGLRVAIPATAPKVALVVGDRLVVLGVRGLPRLEGRHEYTDEEIAGATFALALYLVEPLSRSHPDPEFRRPL